MTRIKPKADQIIAVCAATHGVTASQILGHRRMQPLATARQEVMFLMRMTRGDSHPEIGRRLGGRDHSTSMHGVRQVTKRAAEDADAARLDALTAAVHCPVLAKGVRR